MDRDERARTMTVKQRVHEVLVQELGLLGDTMIKPDDHLEDDLGADSHDRQSLTLALEVEFNIAIPDGDGKTLHTVRELVAYVERQAAATT